MKGIQILDLSIPEMELSTISESSIFKEFCECLDKLERMTSPEFYLEEVIDSSTVKNKMFKGAIQNTANTTLDIMNVYGDIIDANGGVIKSFWDLFMKTLGLAVKVLGFILGKIESIPKLITNVATKIGNIPNDIANKIQGNIKLYITAADISALYNNHLLNKLSTFISLSKRLAEGETWGTFFNKRKSGNSIGKENDIKLCKEMNAIYLQLQTLQFTQTVVYMKDKKSAKQYFGKEDSIQFTDISGKSHNCSYYQALVQLVEDIKSKQDELKVVYQLISSKYNDTQLNNEFSKLGVSSREIIVSSIQMTSKMTAITGGMLKYIMIDMKTIEDATNKILKSSGVKIE